MNLVVVASIYGAMAVLAGALYYLFKKTILNHK